MQWDDGVGGVWMEFVSNIVCRRRTAKKNKSGICACKTEFKLLALVNCKLRLSFFPMWKYFAQMCAHLFALLASISNRFDYGSNPWKKLLWEKEKENNRSTTRDCFGLPVDDAAAWPNGLSGLIVCPNVETTLECSVLRDAYEDDDDDDGGGGGGGSTTALLLLLLT